ncbi:MAG: L,D-transpeptidase family protein [Bacteroidota bacterium]|nr:L,D-transpeptidase family protein [Bacteroidota bacterium]
MAKISGFLSLAVPIFMLSLLVSSCRTNKEEEWETKDYKFGFDPIEFKKCLYERLEKNDTTQIFKVSDLEYCDSLKHFYRLRNFHPVIIRSFEDSLSILSLMNVILNVKEHGLNPENYRYEMMVKELSAFFESRSRKSHEAYDHMVNTELLLANAVSKYAHDIHYGAVNPAKVFRGSYYLPLQDSGKGRILKPLYQENILNYLSSIQPSNQRYKSMQTALRHFESLESQPWDSLRIAPVKLKRGEVYPPLKRVAERLSLLGFMDSSRVSSSDIDVYDSLMIRSIAKFQKANGLKGDGSLGTATIKKLNTPLKDYIEKIKLNMERFRWTTYTDSSRYILVNIPEFYLHAIENGQERLDIKVCTGKNFTYNPNLSAIKNRQNNCETPLLYGKISYMILNPSWTVPVSIVKKEIYGATVKDINYLSKKNFKVYRNGKQVSISSEDLAKYSPNRLPYTFVQRPGEGNALGKIKFMFDNNFSIYLHDTPTRAPFSTYPRAVSHGCVRLEKPFDLAGYILKDNSKWNADFVRLETGNAVEDSSVIKEFKRRRNELRREGADGKTTRINLKKKFPLYIDYFTAWVDEEGHLNMRDDVYNKDEVLKKRLGI